MTDLTAELTQRAASLGDLKDIWGLMKDAASDIPFDVDSEDAQAHILSEVMACCTSGLSTIALGKDKAVKGAVLVRRDDFEWGFRNGDAIHVTYAAVAPSHRGQGVLRTLVAQVQERKVPVFVSVKNGNQLDLAGELEKLGFVRESSAASGWGDLYKWQPPRAPQA